MYFSIAKAMTIFVRICLSNINNEVPAYIHASSYLPCPCACKHLLPLSNLVVTAGLRVSD